MDHAFALIGQERAPQDVEAGRIVLRLGQESRPRRDPRPLALVTLQPRSEMARDTQPPANRRWGGRMGPDQGLDAIRIGANPILGIEVGRQPGPDFGGLPVHILRPSDNGRWLAVSRQEHFHARRAFSRGGAECANAAAAQAGQYALDVLAGAQSVDLIVDTAASVPEPLQGADLHIVGVAALRACAKVPEYRMFGFQRLHRDDLRAASPAPEFDFVLVAGVPALGRGRPLQHGDGALAFAAYPFAAYPFAACPFAAGRRRRRACAT
ncbi:MAG TPA: hypothetical protein VHY32_02185 [Caulobacteraceae bacterium]|nr:hypothetical protein [Caulobacteraceae bacterium]